MCQCFLLALHTTRFNARFIVNYSLFDRAALEENKRIGMRGRVMAAWAWKSFTILNLAPSVREYVRSKRIHIVLAINSIDVFIQPQLGMVNNVEKLFGRPDSAGQRRMLNSAYSTANELIKLAKAAVCRGFYVILSFYRVGTIVLSTGPTVALALPLTLL